MKRGNPDLDKFRPMGVQANERKANEIARKIIEIMDREGIDLATVTRTRAADLLNAYGILTSHGKSWTRERVKSPLKRARQLACPSSGSAKSVRSPSASLPATIHEDGHLHESVKQSIEAIKERRGLTTGDIARELGYDPKNASIGNAMSTVRQSRILDPDLLKELELWLRKHA